MLTPPLIWFCLTSAPLLPISSALRPVGFMPEMGPETASPAPVLFASAVGSAHCLTVYNRTGTPACHGYLFEWLTFDGIDFQTLWRHKVVSEAPVCGSI